MIYQGLWIYRFKLTYRLLYLLHSWSRLSKSYVLKLCIWWSQRWVLLLLTDFLHHCFQSNEFQVKYNYKTGCFSQTSTYGLFYFTVLRAILSMKLWAEALEVLTSLHCKQMTAFLWFFSFFGHVLMVQIQYTQNERSWPYSKTTSCFNGRIEVKSVFSGLKLYTVVAEVFQFMSTWLVFHM